MPRASRRRGREGHDREPRQGRNRPLETKTNKKGEYIQVGLSPGKYRMTVDQGCADDHDGHRHPPRHGRRSTSSSRPGGGGGATGSKEDAAKAKAKADAMTKAFNEGVALSNEGKTDEAIAKFNEVIAVDPELRRVLREHRHRAGAGEEVRRGGSGLQEGDRAEAGLRRGLQRPGQRLQRREEVRPGGRSQQEGDGAGAAAAGGAAARPARRRRRSASAIFNQGVILWNAGKIPEAKAQFEAGREARSEHGRSALLARAWRCVNAGTPERWPGPSRTSRRTSSSRRPGQYAETAKAIVASIK